MESDCTLRFGFKALINALEGPEALLRASSCSVWQQRRIVVCVLLHDYVNVRVCNLHNPHRTGHIENHKQHTADFHLAAFFP